MRANVPVLSERNASMTLSDGRVLAYTDLGMSAGPVVMYFHGAPGSRLDLTIFTDTFAARGVRVISTDRPGCLQLSPVAAGRTGRPTSPPWRIISASSGLR